MTRPAQQDLGPSETRVVLVSGPSWSADIIELIMADHRRIGRLSTVLRDLTRHDGDWMLGYAWQRLADLLVAHTQAEEQICYPLILGSGPQATERMRDAVTDHDDIRELIAEASLPPVGSAPWWRAVRTVLMASAEHLEREEREVLRSCLPGLTMRRRKELGRQWCAFMAAWRRDATPDRPVNIA